MRKGHDHGTDNLGDGRLLITVSVNVLLTFVQIIGGILSGSLSLIADAIHKLSDAASLGVALVARKIGNKPADEYKTFGYKRAEVIAALINLVMLIIVGLYLVYEALRRLIKPEVIEDWTVIIVATVALIVNIITAVLASIGVIVAGTLILLHSWYWANTVLTLIIAGYVLWQNITTLPKTIHLLMEGTPAQLSISNVISEMENVHGVESVHHVYIWQLDGHHSALEAHVVIKQRTLPDIEHIKTIL